MAELTAEIRNEILALVSEFHWRLDHGHADKLHELYAEDGLSVGPMGVMEGRETIKAWGERRSKINAGIVRHFSGGTRVYFEDGVLKSTTYYMTFRDSQPDPLHPASVGEFQEEYVNVEGKWLIQRREIVPVFGAENAAKHAAKVAAGGEK
ncbi:MULTISPECIES: nuclear transport factor 2 family protein [Glutamicibacter]|jgi:hypothetical protein|uniref:Nuclear transport factor 2 family protein n=1 Tax=Glutamicibacter arilaitensis TaxID=256701 RepID=A0A4Y8TUJ7_9MICC|nr:nuclear transport factor 2 family protein [Glutamicibacter arilaitensis]TFH55830.1 nuclear transport factor 2 family protein [Glutamicibacter arilaitensis]